MSSEVAQCRGRRAGRGLLLYVVWLCLGMLAGLARAADFLPPGEAFKVSAVAADAQTIELRFVIADGYYLYRDKFRFAAEPESVFLGKAQLPPGKEKNDDTFGRVEVYYGAPVIRLPVERNFSGRLPLTLVVTMQGCAEAGVCYPPQKQRVQLILPDEVESPAAPLPSASTGAASGDESGRIARLLHDADNWLVLLSFFGFGLLLSLTPCVFPMLPIVSSIIVGAGRGRSVSSARAFVLSLVYVLGMATTYAAAGVAAGLSGTLLVVALQNAWVLGTLAVVFVVLALAMFDVYQLQLPSFLQSRAAHQSAHLRGGSLPAVALMGALSALLVGPCVAAPLAGALLYIGQSGNAWLGGGALFCLALGMGVPLLVVGASAGALLPKAGAWMKSVQKACGVLLLATAWWMVTPLLPVALQMLGWAALLIVPAIFLHAIDPLPTQAGVGARLGKAMGLLMLLIGAAMLAGALSGARDPLRPLAALRGGAGGSETRPLAFERVRSPAELEARLQAPGQPVLLDFYADWCVSCKEMERDTFADPRVRQALAGWTLLQADVTANSADDAAMLARFGLYGPPGTLFFDVSGKEVRGVRVVGYQNATDFLATLARVRPPT